MAKIKQNQFGIPIGRVGNLSFYDSPLGPIMRTRNKPISKKTPAGDLTHEMFRFSTQLWAKLTLEQVEQWKKLAASIERKDKANNIIHWRGRDLFNKVNRNRLEMNEPYILDPPEKINPQSFTSFKVEITGMIKLEDIKLHFEPELDKDTMLHIFATPQLSMGKHFIKNCWYRKIGYIDSSFKSGDSILDKYRTVFIAENNQDFRIAFIFKPVSSASGFSAPGISVLEAPIS